MITQEIKCPFCNSQLNPDKIPSDGNGFQVCEFCGQTFYLNDGITRSEHVERKIDEARILEAKNESIRLQLEQDKLARELEQKEKTKFKRGALSKIVIVCFVLSIFLTMLAFDYTGKGHIIQKASAISQIILFALSWLTGMNYLDLKVKNIHVFLAIAGFVMYIPFVANL